MTTTPPAIGLAERYERDVLPRLIEHLDRAFPEFGFIRDRDGWIATNDQTTHALLGCRANRVVCHGNTPRGILIHGQGPVLFTTLANQMRPARGRDFVTAAHDLAARVGVDLETQREPTAYEVRSRILHDTLVLARRELQSDQGTAARAYLVKTRGMPDDVAETQAIGLVPPRSRLAAGLAAAGWTRQQIDASGVLNDPRWPGRLVGAWRDTHGHPRTLWTRSIDVDEPAETRYLYLKNAPRRDLPPYGLSDLIADRAHHDLVLVEGVLDLHHLRARGIQNVAALGGLSTSPQLFARLDSLGVRDVTLMLDNDEAGRIGTLRAINNAIRAERSPDLHIARLPTGADPDDLLLREGSAAIANALAARRCAITWRVQTILGATPTRNSIRDAGAWLGALPERLSLEQDAAVLTVAQIAGLDGEATRRTFRARYWTRTAAQSRAEHQSCTTVRSL